MKEHSHLSNRSLLSFDVAEAITNLVGAEPNALPRALTREQILDQLLEMVESWDGPHRKLPAAIRDAMSEKLANRLINSAVFQAGYKRYETESSNLVVPVTNFFFSSVYDGDKSLSRMTEFEAQNSLPKRQTQINPLHDPEKTEEEVKAMKDTPIPSGPIAGIVIFPPNYGSRRKDGENPILLNHWLARGIRTVEGCVKAVANKLVNARPDTKAAISVRDTAKTFGPDMRRALPRLP